MRAVGIVRKLTMIDPKATRDVLYEGSKAFFVDHGNNKSIADPKSGTKIIEAIFEIAVLGPSTSDDSAGETESLRLKRSDSLLAYVNVGTVDRVEALTSRIQTWIESERSPQVRQTLQAAQKRTQMARSQI